MHLRPCRPRNSRFVRRSLDSGGARVRLRWVAMRCVAAGAIAALQAASCFAASTRAGADEALGRPKTLWSLTYENDSFVGSDRHYTSGVQIAATRRNVSLGPSFAAAIAPACRMLSCAAQSPDVVHDRIGQLIYTPERISIVRPQPDDRPWAGMLYYAREHVYVSPLGDRRTLLTGMIGVIGPGSGAAETQRRVHEVFDKGTPRGWHNQIGGELGLMAIVESRHGLGLIWSGDPGEVEAGVTGSWRVAVGNIMTFAGAGVALGIGKHLAPALPRSDRISPGAFGETRGGCGLEWLSCAAFGSVEGRVVLRNVFLDGPLFRDGPSVDRRPFVLDASLGLRFDFPRTRNVYTGAWFVSFMVTRRSPEFRAPGRRVGSQSFGSLTVGATI